MNYGIIDADSIAYRGAAAAQKRIWDVFVEDALVASMPYKQEAIDWAAQEEIENPVFKLRIEPEPLENALSNTKAIIKGIVEYLSLDGYELHLTGDSNYRFDLATIKPYKGNRNPDDKPIHLGAVRNYLLARYGASLSDGCEADDTVSMRATELADSSDRCIIISIDKDLHTVPGEHFDFVKQSLITISEDEAMYNFYHQMITGDTIDNIKGIYRKGKKAADKILSETSNYKCAVGIAYACSDYEDPEAAFEENARLLWMSRKQPNDWSWDIT